MKKVKKKTIRRKLTTLLREYVLKRDKKCVRCGRTEGKLDLSHIFPKGTHRSMEHNHLNCIILCFRCHQWWHHNPLESAEWFRSERPERSMFLRHLARTNTPCDTPFYEAKEKELRELNELPPL